MWHSGSCQLTCATCCMCTSMALVWQASHLKLILYQRDWFSPLPKPAHISGEDKLVCELCSVVAEWTCQAQVKPSCMACLRVKRRWSYNSHMINIEFRVQPGLVQNLLYAMCRSALSPACHRLRFLKTPDIWTVQLAALKDRLRIAPQNLVGGPLHQSTWMFR